MITSGSVLCGIWSLLLTHAGRFEVSAVVLVLAVFFDFMDGKVARSLGGSSMFGEELDSLADSLSFGAAPAFLVYARYIGAEGGIFGAVATAFFALCGVLRLARFNIMHVVGPFQGLPIPAGGMALAAMVIGRVPLSPVMAMVALVALGSLMISTIQYGNLKLLKRGNVNRAKVALVVCASLATAIILRERALLALIGVYIASGPIGLEWGSWLAIDPPTVDDHAADHEEH